MKIYSLIVAGILLLAVAGCDNEDEAPELSLDDLVGSWKASSVVITSNSDPEQEMELIALGAELRFTMLDHYGVRTWFVMMDYTDEWDSQAELDGTTLTMTAAEDSRDVTTFDVELDGDVLVLTNDSDSFDFSLTDTSEVSVTSVSTFMRQ